jgi:hypothetical protein
MKYDEIRAKVKNQHLIKDAIIDLKDLTESNILDYTKFLQSNKETVISELSKTLAQYKLIGSADDISLNELITKGFD